VAKTVPRRKAKSRKKIRHAKQARKAKERALKAEQRCALCGEGGRLRRVKLTVDGKAVVDYRACQMCRAVLEVLLRDPRRHRL
jgi:hypothetical protein